MNAPFKAKLSLLQTALAAVLFLSATQSAFAGFTVMDDDLFPSQPVPASVIAAAQAQVQARYLAAQRTSSSAPLTTAETSETYSILFRKNIYGLNEEGNDSVIDLLPSIQGKKIIITGRPDAVTNPFLAKKRADTLRTWLIRHGIPDTDITTRIQETANNPVGLLFPVEIRVVGNNYPEAAKRPMVATQPATQQPASVSNGIRTVVTPMPIQPQPTATVAIIATPNPDARLDMVRQLANAAIAGRLDAKAAIATIAERLSVVTPVKAPTSAPAPVVAAPAAPVVPPSEFQLIAAPETARPKEWVLSSEKTLRDNAVEWAKKEGYELDWKATNYFKVGRTAPVTGDLLDVLDRVTTAAGLKMDVWKKDRLIRISDRP